MADEPHEVVKLLLARMDSHPEEFRLKDPSYHDRWYNHMNAINSYGNEADIAALNAKVRDIRMAEVHEQVLEELCSGEDRRREEREEQEYERHLARSLQHTKRQQLAVANGGTGATIARHPTSADMENNGVMGALRKLI